MHLSNLIYPECFNSVKKEYKFSHDYVVYLLFHLLINSTNTYRIPTLLQALFQAVWG
jgi:hypothetical protein